MACNKNHKETDKIVENIELNQGGFGRHKCASCAYEKGLEDGRNKFINPNIENLINSLDFSQKGLRRHRDPFKAYTIGFFHGLCGAQNHPVNKDKYNMAAQMRDLGLYMVAKGAYQAIIPEDKIPYSHAMSVVQAAHGFEILIKSRIVEEHPLLIFSKLPLESNVENRKIKIENLLEHGQTTMYKNLPERLWAATGYTIPSKDLYNNFGKIRNQIIHFALPEQNLCNLTHKYVYTIVEKCVNDWWDETILEYASEYDNEYYKHIFEKLKSLKIDVKFELNDNILVKKVSSLN